MLVPMHVVNWISSSSQFPFVLQISTRKVPIRNSTGMKYRDKSPFRMPGCHTRCWLLNDSSFRLSTSFMIQFLHIVLFSVISSWRYTPLLTNPPGHEASPKLILWECLKVNLPSYPHTSCKRLQNYDGSFPPLKTFDVHWLLIFFIRRYRGSWVVKKACVALHCVIVMGCGWARDWRKVQR